MKNIKNILDIFEIKQSFNSARDYNGYINYPERSIDSPLKILHLELQKGNVDKELITVQVIFLDRALTTDYFWWRFNPLCEELNKLFNLGLTLRPRPQI